MLKINHVSDKALEKMAIQHERIVLVRDYLTQSKAFVRYEIAQKINTDLNKYFSSIQYFAEKQDLSTQIVIDRIKSDAKSIDHSTFANEWERLKTIDSHTVERILITKIRLDRAIEPLSKEIQTRGFENAVKA